MTRWSAHGVRTALDRAAVLGQHSRRDQR
jgi:hypothetical protein